MTIVRCPALFVSAPASGQGKTTVTAGLARLFSNQGLKVRVFKTGPDFLDPMILERASGAPVYQLDLWMGGKAHCRELLYRAAAQADLILIEGVMGLFDGQPSSADLAELFDIPVLAIIDASAMAETFGAIAFGLANFRTNISVAGVVANRVGSPGHAAMLAESVAGKLAFLGALSRDDTLALPSRHLGLVQAEELADIDARLDRIATALETSDVRMPDQVAFAPPAGVEPAQSRLSGLRIAVANDRAFSFLYAANLDLLRAEGAELLFFSPLDDGRLPQADAVYLPGGYPELHLDRLSTSSAMHAALKAHVEDGKPLLAECGGLLYLLDRLTDAEGHSAPMAGILPG
ncbi:MAG: cobyrinate a,c-diamide synthase, partial [Alphaproteobacteria bacterium]|nr:cobyrinate a,c-diamide synthase [Alphaproteobacteria bacterium]